MKLLLIGPLPEPTTGVSLANKIVEKYLPKFFDVNVEIIDTNYSVFKEDVGKFNFNKIYYSVAKYKEIFKIKNVDKVYMTIGQTFFGVLKYSPYFLFAKLLKKEIIVHIHGNHLWKEYSNLCGIKKKIFFRILSMVDKGIVLSKSLIKNLTPIIDKEKIYVLENFVEDYLFDNNLKKDYNNLKIIYLSNLMTEKGILDLLNALLILKSENIPFKAQIAGNIDVKLKDQIDELFDKVGNSVKYLGIVKGKDKKRLLDWGNVFVFPTYYKMEGQPISLFEAMATGNVIVTTKHAGIPDVFKENINGYYVEKKSPKSIADKLSELNTNLVKLKDISYINQKEAKEKYRVKIFIEKLYNIIKDKEGNNETK